MKKYPYIKGNLAKSMSPSRLRNVTSCEALKL
ncbi:hypothetical protein Bhyg_06889 [Pseudolycoriella hygida]|uniref:Uncharacterized protein n=1 Tax=Pseudolycoriella hygida TaxID=35572 RepID=A0A9Q0N1L5_9DIPT|nr:hypothetical protein Bhyg_06889 [Pseudolycoriella hygida]